MPETILPMIPDVPADVTARQKTFVSALKEIAEVREGRRGDPLDAFVSIRDLLDLLSTDQSVIARLRKYHGHIPIGAYYFNNTGEDPAVKLGYGTWILTGKLMVDTL